MSEERFPMDILELFLVKSEKYNYCKVCQHIAPYILHYLIDDPNEMINQGCVVIEFEQIWKDMVQRQFNDDFQSRHFEYLCQMHASQRLSIALGKFGPIAIMIHGLNIDKNIHALAVFCEVSSFEDEGNTWIGASPYKEIEQTRTYLLKRKEKEELH